MSLVALASVPGCSSPDGTANPGADDTGASPRPPDEQVDVLVIGAGLSGMVAALSALEAGAEDVVVLERREEAGGSAWYAGSYIAAGTPWQEELGIDDSPELLLSEWSDATGGGDPTDEVVQAFAEQSAEVLEWFVETTGASVSSVSEGPDTGPTPRKHWLAAEEAAAAMVELLGERVRTSTEATALVVEEGRVVGAEWRRLDTGEEGWTRAGATVLASGGFARNEEMVLAHVPQLDGAAWAPEASHAATGAGHALAEGVGADWHNPGGYGIYVHSVADPREGFEGEAILLPDLPFSTIVDESGHRVANEDDTRSFSMFGSWVEAEGRRLVAIFDEETFLGGLATVPGYNWPVEGEPEDIQPKELVDAGAARRYGGLEELAAGEGIDADGLLGTAAAIDEAIATGSDPFGRDAETLRSISDGPLYAIELIPGVAKSFTGFRAGADGRLLDADGEPIEGLYGAGEVIGMLGTDAVGRGFGGSANACVWTGVRAGREAAAAALGG